MYCANSNSKISSKHTEDNLIFKMHSYPGEDGTRGASGYSEKDKMIRGDMSKIRYMANRFYKNNKYTHEKFPKHFIFHPYTQSVYQYTPKVHNIHLDKVAPKNNILGIIKKLSKSPLYE